MEGGVDSDGTSVDIEPVITENGKCDIHVKDIDESDNEVELKIVEDRDLVESGNLKDTNVVDNGENGKCVKSKNEPETEPDENGQSKEVGETLSNDVTNTEAERSEKKELDSDTNKTIEDGNQLNETKEKSDDANNIETGSQQWSEALETSGADTGTNAEIAASDIIEITEDKCNDTKSAETAGSVSGTEVVDESAKTGDSNEGDSAKDINTSALKDDIVEDNDEEGTSDQKRADIDSFLTSVCEEMIQGLIEAEKELTDDTSEVPKGIIGETATKDMPLKKENDSVDMCKELVVESAESADVGQAKGGQANAEPEEVVENNGSKDIKLEKLEAQNMLLQRELQDAKSMIHVSQMHTRDQQAKHNQMVMSLKLQLYKNQAMLKQERAKSEKQMSEVIAHLMMLEGRLKREQCRVKQEMKQKNKVVENQKLEILKLREQNEQLLNAIKEICEKGGMNGYMRDKKKGGSPLEPPEGGKMGKDKKVHNGKFNTVKDKFSWKNRSSLELNNFDMEKYLIKSGRMYSSHEDLHNTGKSRGERSVSNLVEGNIHSPHRAGNDLKEKSMNSPGDVTNEDHKKSPNNSQNFFYDDLSPKLELSTSVSESSQLSENSSTSGFQSLSDHDISNQDTSIFSNHHGNDECHDDDDDDDDDDNYFSFSSTRINTVIDEEEVIGYGQMTSMGSMPNISNRMSQRLHSNKDRPHSLSSVDLASIQQQAETLSHVPFVNVQSEMQTPPSSPSAVQNKAELTPFQTFKTMFKRKGSKNKGKKRSVSLSQTTNKEYTEAMKKHFQKYDMS